MGRLRQLQRRAQHLVASRHSRHLAELRLCRRPLARPHANGSPRCHPRGPLAGQPRVLQAFIPLPGVHPGVGHEYLSQATAAVPSSPREQCLSSSMLGGVQPSGRRRALRMRSRRDFETLHPPGSHGQVGGWPPTSCGRRPARLRLVLLVLRRGERASERGVHCLPLPGGRHARAACRSSTPVCRFGWHPQAGCHHSARACGRVSGRSRNGGRDHPPGLAAPFVMDSCRFPRLCR